MKTVLITGANKGIGFETAKQLAQQGYFIYLGSRDLQKGEEAVKKLQDAGVSNIEAVGIDVTNGDSIKQAAATIKGKGRQLDILINNAGVAAGQPQDFAHGDLNMLREIFETNFFGVIATTQAMLPLLQQSAEPVIVNVSSELGSLGLHTNGSMPVDFGSIWHFYATSKTALNAFTVHLAKEFRNSNFKINSVTPGYTATDLNGFAGTQTVEEGARALVQLVVTGNGNAHGEFFRINKLPW
jgi:NAD(P)-dependent dehydrogenase (short-subunit alcohol dehydrogenase family)